MWSIISLITGIIGLFADHMSDKEEEKEQEARDQELQDLRQRVALLEKKED